VGNVFILYENDILNMYDKVQYVEGVFVSMQAARDYALSPERHGKYRSTDEGVWPGFSIESQEVRA